MKHTLRPIVIGLAAPVVVICVVALASPRDAQAVDPPVPLPTLNLLSPLPTIDLEIPLPTIDLGTPLPSIPLPTIDLGTPLPSIDLGTPLPSIDLGTPLPSIDLATPAPSIGLGTPVPSGKTPIVHPTESARTALPRESEPAPGRQGGAPDGADLDRGPAAGGDDGPTVSTGRVVRIAPLRPFDPSLPGIGFWLPAAVSVVPALVAVVLAVQLAGGAMGLRFVRSRLDRLASAAPAWVRR